MTRPLDPLADLRFSLVGAGKVGTSLASWAVSRGATLLTVAGRAASERGHEGAERLGADFVPLEELSSADQELLLIAVPDPALAEVAERLAARPQARVALHVSGSRPAAVLEPLRRAGCAIGSLHPLRAFPLPCLDPQAAAGILFAIDGDPTAEQLARRLVTSWDGAPVRIEAGERPLYHFAATLAAGGVVTLLAAAVEIAAQLNLPREVLGGYLALARSALDGIEHAGAPAPAITGPAARGDVQTVLEQIAAVRIHGPELAELARVLARETCRQLRRDGRADPQLAALEMLLSERGR